MFHQFFGKPFQVILAALAGVFLLSVLVFKTALTGPFLVLVILGTFVLTWKRLEWGLVAAFAELFANSHGHLVDAPLVGLAFSMREAVFVGVMAGWVVSMIRLRKWEAFRDPRLTMFLPLAAAVALGFVMGFIQHGPKEAFQDGNAYLYLLYVLPILSVRWTDETRRLLLQTLAAGAVWVSALTLGLLFVFTHVPKFLLSHVYTFIRDTRTGELTEMLGFFRIFLQAQMSVMVFLVLLSVIPLAMNFTKKAVWKWVALVSVFWSVVIISLSRSFWVGLAGALFVALGLLLRERKLEAKRTWGALGMKVATVFGGLVILVAAVLFPFPARTTSIGSLSDLLSARTTDVNDVAISSRWNLLPEMMKVIFQSPVIGSGFGQTVTFKTDDPRARAIYPDGTWTTDAFEWGWLDLWLKMGILGPLAFLALLGALFNGLRPLFSTDRAWLGVGLFSAVVLVFATHALSPYLNHPLGLGVLLFCLPFMPPAVPAEAVAMNSAEAPVAAVSSPVLASTIKSSL